MIRASSVVFSLTALSLLFVLGCGPGLPTAKVVVEQNAADDAVAEDGSEGEDDATVVEEFTIGGTLSGYGGSVTLQNNGANDLVITANGAFSFSAKVASGSNYAVTVSAQPGGYSCAVSNGSGTATADVTNVAVTCTSLAKVIRLSSGTTTGLLGGTAAAAVIAADALCGAGYKAMIYAAGARNSTTDWALAPDTTYVRADGTTTIGITDSNGLLSTPLTNSIGTTADEVWTGFWDHYAAALHCGAGWVTDAGGQFARYGVANASDANWVAAAHGACNVAKYLYCVQQ